MEEQTNGRFQEGTTKKSMEAQLLYFHSFKHSDNYKQHCLLQPVIVLFPNKSKDPKRGFTSNQDQHRYEMH